MGAAMKLNIGSGQRRFANEHGWINIDCVSRDGQVPDLICDVGRDSLPYPRNSVDLIVLHQVYEHFGCGEGHDLLREIYRTLKPEGSLILTVPDMRALAARWLSKQIDNYIFMVNVYGAYQGEPGDRHKWGYNSESLREDLWSAAPWRMVIPFDWRPIEGADIARDWWILGMEAVK
jgi:SAM-dependent methyltransferase